MAGEAKGRNRLILKTATHLDKNYHISKCEYVQIAAANELPQDNGIDQFQL